MRDERLFPLFAELDTLPGIGPKLKPVFERLIGGSRVWDLLLHLPERWLDRRVRETFEAAETGEVATVQGEVQSHIAPRGSGAAPYRVRLADDTGFLTLVFFRGDGRWISGQLPVGKSRIVSGRVEEFNGERQIVHPDHIYDPAKPDRPPPVEPIYGLTAGLTNKRVHNAMLAALETLPDLPEWSDPHLVAARQWPTFRDALTILHAPDIYDEEAFDRALDRLAYDEALARETAFALARAARRQRRAPEMPTARSEQNRLAASLPFKPTGAQVRATQEIGHDLAKPSPMRRMLQGDVGSGKTLVGALAAVQAAASGHQTAFMAPTEVLARQQFTTLDTWLTPLGFNIAALTGRDKGTTRQSIMMGLGDGSIQIVAGTHALFQEAVAFHRLGLVIVDEQHRFGVMDRARLADKAISPHMLVMSATPIPRTLALAVNGDLDISILDEKPAGRKPVETRAIPDTRLDDVISAVGRATARGEQAFWVCPRVDADDDESNAVTRAAVLKDALGVEVGLVHGRLKPAEKDAALDTFRSGQSRVLVATTVIEVGVDVPNATIMVIERAEGFGLAQLHQLRGRVGRGDKPAFCLLVYRAPLGEHAKARLETLRRTEDGFEIAEADYRLRGPGDTLGLKQSGLPVFHAIKLDRHNEFFAIARKDAQALVERDPDLQDIRGEAVRLLRELLSPRIERPEN
ncbi:MAG: ATP-dependent DNA helicase RecG [Pseudomonadota bacterium]